MGTTMNKTLLLSGLASAVVTLVVGCGSGREQRQPLTRTPTPNATGTNNVDPKTGKPITASQQAGKGRDFTPGADGLPKEDGDVRGNDPNKRKDPTKDTVTAGTSKDDERVSAKQGEMTKKELVGTPVTADQVAAGSYELKSVVVSVLVTDVNGDFARAIKAFDRVKQGNGYILKDLNDADVSGKLTTTPETAERFVDLPMQFKKKSDSARWESDFEAAVNTSITTRNNKIETKANLDPQQGKKASVLSILTSTTPSDSSYSITDEKQKPIIVRIYKQADNSLRIWVAITELKPAKTDSKGTKSMAFERNLFFDYKYSNQ